MRHRLAVPIIPALVLGLIAGGALAQSRARIFDVELGTSIDALPLEDFVDPACGTNGGPPSLPLDGFHAFARCPVEAATGLREIWFIYENEWEYIARAQRDPNLIKRYSANTLFQQPIITSLLIDAAGTVQGFRVVTDPRAPIDVRKEAYLLAGPFKTLFNDAPWTCADLPRDERERPIEGEEFVKQSCEMRSDKRLAKVEVRNLYKAGQDLRVNPRELEQAQGDFESSTSIAVYSLAAVKDAPCCRASAPR